MKILKASSRARVAHIPVGLPLFPRAIRLCSDDVEEFGEILEGTPTCPVCIARLKDLIITGHRHLRTHSNDQRAIRTVDLLEQMYSNLHLSGD